MRLSSQAYRRARPIAIVIAALLFVVALERSAEIYFGITALKAAPEDNVQWSLFQVNTDYYRLEAAALRLTSPAPAAIADFRKRFDIYYSRVDLLRSGAEFAKLRSAPDIAPRLGTLFEGIEAIARIVDAGSDSIVRDRNRIGELVAAQHATVRDLMAAAIKHHAAAADRERQSLADLLTSAAVLIALLVAFLTSVAILLMRQMQALQTRTEELVSSRSQAAATIRASLDAIVVTDDKGRIIEWNNAAQRCFGYSRAEALGRPFSDIITTDRPGHANAEVLLLSDDVNDASAIGRRFETDARHADGHVFPIELAISAASAGPDPTLVAFVRDISERRKTDDELRSALAMAEAGSRAKARFLAVMSHEMRTPLGGVIGSLDLLSRTPLAGEQQVYVDTALQSSELLLAQINDVLDISKMDADRVKLEVAPFALREMLKSALSVLSPLATRNGNILALEIDEELPRTVVGDHSRLRQVIVNLASNALKFTEAGTVSVIVRSIGGGRAGANIEFAVKDTGIGIEDDQIGDLFKEFSVLDPSYTRRVGGSGLGLAICQRLVTAMGGRISVVSQVGIGSVFYFRIRLEALVEEASADTGEEGTADFETLSVPLRILVADDVPANRMVARGMLESAGHSVITVDNGREAYESASARHFDLILMDVSMPELDGVAATALIRRLPGAAGRIPIIAMTAHAIAGDRERFLSAGMTDYLSKPVRREALFATIAEVMASVEGASAKEAEQQDAAHDTIDEPGEAAMAETTATGVAGGPSPGEAADAIDDGHTLLIDRRDIDRLADEITAAQLPTILRAFLDEIDLRFDEITAACKTADAAALAKSAHALAGVSATVGARRLAEISRDIEECCSGGNAAAGFDRSDALKSAIRATHQAYAELPMLQPVQPLAA